jgi:sugar fermentation stimulation protein A
MKACSEPGRPVYLSFHDSPSRKLKYTWEIIDMGTSLVGVNTNIPNRLVRCAIEAGRIPELSGYGRVDSEVTVSESSRLDLMLSDPAKGKCYIEVKNCTLVTDGHAHFPDAVTSRGLKHIDELITLHKKGHRCAMFYLIQRMDVHSFGPADGIDPAYGKGLRKAVASGIEIVVYDVKLTSSFIEIGKSIPLIL